LLPRLDRVGVPLFHPPLQPAPPDAHMVPFQDIWVRSRPYPERFPQLAYVISGQGEMILGRFWLSLPSGQGVFVPSGIPHAPHASRGERILPSDWLRVLIYPFGVIVHRCRITPSAHEKSLRYFVANPILSDLFQAWEQGLQGSGNPFRQKSLLCAFFCLLAESSPVPVNPMDWLPPDLESFPFPVQRGHPAFTQWLSSTLSAPRLGKAMLCKSLPSVSLVPATSWDDAVGLLNLPAVDDCPPLTGASRIAGW